MCVCVHPDLPSMRCSSVRVVVPAPFLGEWTHINSLPQGEPLSDYRTDNGDLLNIVLNSDLFSFSISKSGMVHSLLMKLFF